MPDVYKACERFEQLGVPFIKTPTGGDLRLLYWTANIVCVCVCAGKMKGIAFITDPDGYWIEILSPNNEVTVATN